MGIKNKRKRLRSQIHEHARMAKMLLPAHSLQNCPPYTRAYFESFRSQLFSACRRSRHRHCPRTSDQKDEHLYCSCPCHRRNLSSYQKRKMWFQMKQDLAKSERKQTVRNPNAVRTTVGTKGQKKTFRYLHAPDGKIPAGIMAIVHDAISTLKQGTVAEVTSVAITNGLEKVTGQDPTTQTSVMLHRMLKSGVVEVT